MIPRLLAAALLTLSACGEEPADAPPAAPAAPASPAAPAAPPAPAAPAVALDGEGLRLVDANGSTRPLPFGMAAADTVTALQRTGRAEPRRSTNAECGAGPLAFADWPDGLQLVFQEDKFVGWNTRQGSGLQTISGVGVGSTRRQLEAAYAAKVEETTLGQEFEAGGLGGLLSGPGPDARIETLWAGITCAFR